MAGDGALASGLGLSKGLALAAVLLTVLAVFEAESAAALPNLPPGLAYVEDPDEPAAASSALDDYSDNDLGRFVNPVKRACVRRGGNCDHRPNDCCYNSSCRCNLWGANCRCQRMGLFQKWGRK
ncbi:uncharacterized protein LOC127752335 isoform X2 [Frankliniella occidentalis]|uniref:Uncharacterized protein LOC127752335 isoform X2 n=1 Tax=Frankliniella occidentalis TaxID=133901 RepID=A0A9C6XCG2_FRAOC|nr:uncharacterized protein LOC127752335 isoform X2 [Frankliniella occidentalis]